MYRRTHASIGCRLAAVAAIVAAPARSLFVHLAASAVVVVVVVVVLLLLLLPLLLAAAVIAARSQPDRP